jgi:hypothetical protein
MDNNSENKSRIEALINNDTNGAKMRLARIRDELEEYGLTRKAKSLDTIISRLESWQNKKIMEKKP